MVFMIMVMMTMKMIMMRVAISHCNFLLKRTACAGSAQDNQAPAIVANFMMTMMMIIKNADDNAKDNDADDNLRKGGR